VANNGLQGKGVIAEGVTVALNIPTGYTVVAATGTGYQGVNGNVATWRLPRSAPKDQERLTITLSQAASASANLRGEIRWAKPAMAPNLDPTVVIAAAPL
jgi:hypothetical protein